MKGLILKRAAVLSAVFFLFIQITAMAAVPVKLKAVRFSSSPDKDRLVFEMSSRPDYRIMTEDGGRRVIIELFRTRDCAAVKPAAKSRQVKTVKYDTTADGKVRITIDMTSAADYTARTLKSPERLYIDIYKNFERRKTTVPAAGIRHTVYERRTIEGLLTAHFVEVDNRRYIVRPVLANGIVPGRATVKAMAAASKSPLAVNASYFAPDGSILGYLRLDGITAGTTWFNRTAVGIRKDGSVLFGKLSYSAYAQLGRVQLPLAGVDCERGENGLVVYNRWFGRTTGTNVYGKEYIVRGNIVTRTAINNSLIPADGLVVSAHGRAKEALKNVRAGERVRITELLDACWTGVPYIIGAGPRLVAGGLVRVTADEEEFPDDIRVGRAPRTAFGVLRNGHYLLAVVDGRQLSSIGCTLTEWAELLRREGAVEAINFDGGGSTEMVLNGRTVNSPSDGRERPVASALVVLPRRAA